MEEKTYKIGELAKLVNDTTRTLRYYEELSLLEPLRTESGQRVYSESAIQRLKLIQELKVAGFGLSQIQGLFQAWNGDQSGGEASKQTLSVLETKVFEIETLQKRLQKLQADFKSMIRYLSDCRPCEHRPSVVSCSQCDRHEGSQDPGLLSLIKRG